MPWTLDEDAAAPIFRQALELGITFWDTANIYGQGTSEEIVGRASEALHAAERRSCSRRSCSSDDGRGPGGRPLPQGDPRADRRVTQRLNTDYVDLYQIHRFDPDTPGRGDDGSPSRRRQGWQGAIHRRLVDVGVAVRQDAARRRDATAGRSSSRCRISTACSTARRSARCSACSRTRASAACRGARWPAGGSRVHGESGTTRGAREPQDVDPQGRPLLLDWRPGDRRGRSRRRETAASRWRRSRMAWVLRNPVVSAPIVGRDQTAPPRRRRRCSRYQLTDDEIRSLEEPYIPREPTY